MPMQGNESSRWRDRHRQHARRMRYPVNLSCRRSKQREQDFSDVAHQDVDSLFAVDYSLGRSETLKKFHSHVLPLSGEKA